jgi:hypothetical protein
MDSCLRRNGGFASGSPEILNFVIPDVIGYPLNNIDPVVKRTSIRGRKSISPHNQQQTEYGE